MSRPLLFPLLGLIFGIASAPFYPWKTPWGLVVLAFAGLLLSVSAWRRWRLGSSLGVLILFFGVGQFSASHTLLKIKDRSNLLSLAGADKLYLVGRVEEPCENQGEGGKLVLKALAARQGDRLIGLSGKLLLRIGRSQCPFRQGDVVQTYAELKAPHWFKNRFSFDARFYLLTQGITATAFVEADPFVVKIGEERRGLNRFLIDLRDRVRSGLSYAFKSGAADPRSKDSEAVLRALLLGEKGGLSKELENLFRNTGTTHLLVVSGLHLVMVGGFFYLFFRALFSLWPPLLLRISVRSLSALFSLLPVLGYSALVGFSPSVLRASFTAVLLGLLLLLAREKDPLGLLFLAAFVLLAVKPLFLFNLSFQLSFLSVLSILVLLPLWEKWLERRFPALSRRAWFRWGLGVMLASLAVQIGLLPILIHRFHQLSAVSLPANLVLVPVFTFWVMPLGFLGMIFSAVHPASAPFFYSLAATALPSCLDYLRFLASLPGAAPYVPGFGFLQIVLYYLLLGFLLLRFSKKMKAAALILLVTANLGVFLWHPLFDRSRKDLSLSFLDVGQGDSLLVELPHGKKMLVDGGGSFSSSFDLGEQVLLPHLLARGIWHLDILVITHPHPDHFGGMKALLKAYRPQEVWWNGQESGAPSFTELLSEIRKRGISLRVLNSRSPSFEWGGAHFDIFHPASDTLFSSNDDSATVNNNSLAMRLTENGFSIFLAGDIQEATEKRLLEDPRLRPITLLKVPHHGSKTSSTEGFLSVLQPKVAVMGVGEGNRFGFPHGEVLSRYRALGTQVFRTDEDGEIDLRWDGKNLWVSTFRGKSLRF